MTVLDELFGKPKALIAMAHFPPVPGQPLHDTRKGSAASATPWRATWRSSRRAARTRSCSATRATGLIAQRRVLRSPRSWPPSSRSSRPICRSRSASTFSAIRSRRSGSRTPSGPHSCARSSAAPTRATSGSGARIRPPLSYRRQIGADDVKLFFNVTAEVATPIAPRDIGLTAKSAVFSSLAEAVCVSGGITGSEVDAEQLRRAKAAVGDGAAVIANTGVRPQTVGEMLGLADGCIVGTSLKREGNTWNEVDGERVERLVAAAAESGLWSTGGEAR